MRSRTKALHKLLVASVLLALCSCMADTRHLAFVSVAQEGWAQTDTLNYSVAPLVGVGECGISLVVQTENYAYENIAIAVAISQDSTLLYHQRHYYNLEEGAPKNGIGRRCEYTFPMGNVTLCDTMATTIALTHQLCDSLLMGISKVGIRIEKPLHQSGEVEWMFDWH